MMPEDLPIKLKIFEDSRHRCFVGYRREHKFAGRPLRKFRKGKKVLRFALAVSMLADFL